MDLDQTSNPPERTIDLPRGDLKIELERDSTSGGIVVLKVSDKSPLSGQIRNGDIITKFMNKSLENMELDQFAKILIDNEESARSISIRSTLCNKETIQNKKTLHERRTLLNKRNIFELNLGLASWNPEMVILS